MSDLTFIQKGLLSNGCVLSAGPFKPLNLSSSTLKAETIWTIQSSYQGPSFDCQLPVLSPAFLGPGQQDRLGGPTTALHCTALHCNSQHCTSLHCTALHFPSLYFTALHYFAQKYRPLHCTSRRVVGKFDFSLEQCQGEESQLGARS